MLAILGDGDRVGVQWVGDAAALPYYERSAPMLHLLHWWLSGLGLYLLHAGAVGLPESGALIVGPGGTGKSTTALACLGSELGYLGDDYTLVSTTPRPRAINLLGTAKVERDDMARLAGVVPHVDNPEPAPGDKALYFIDPAHILDQTRLSALVLPRIVEARQSRIVPLDSAAPILAALAPTSILQLPGAGARTLRTIRDMCEQVPCYRLELGGDIDALPAVLGELLGV
jgi:hypothetical protein